jgi:predicted TIM-barrel fold metal-dependent hydrolase
VAPLATRLIERAPDRCVWGSDWPHTNLPGPEPDDARLLGLVSEWAPDAATRDKILVANPARLYGF